MGFLHASQFIGPIPMCDSWTQARHVKIHRRKSKTKDKQQ